MRECAVLAMAGLTACLAANGAEQMFRAERYERGDTNIRPQQAIDEADWIWLPGREKWGEAVFHNTRTDAATLAKEQTYFLRFRKDFQSDGMPFEIDVSADERFVLILDGREIARGPHRGLKNHWHYQSYRISGLSAGTHRMEAVVWQVGEHAPLAQVSVRGGFILKASGTYDAELTTGKAKWLAAELHGTRMTWKGKSGAFGVGSQCEVSGCGVTDEMPEDAAFAATEMVRGKVHTGAGLTMQGWMLFPTILHDMMHEFRQPGKIVAGENILRPDCVIPAESEVVVFWDLGNYFCAYPRLEVTGGKGAEIDWDWAECLTGPDDEKGDRSAWQGLDIAKPFGDVFRCDGRMNAVFSTPWWRAGKWCRIKIRTGGEPLTIHRIGIVETRYPVKLEAKFECDDPFINSIQKLCERSLQMCMHEMFFDCPYYEQQMYPGDSRLQFLVAGLFDREDRMVRNAMTLFDADRRDNGMIPMNAPTRGMQDALGFGTCELMMFEDRALYNDNPAWLRARLPGMNHSLMGFGAYERPDGLLVSTPGWNFIDWVRDWPGGVPPDGDSDRPNAEMNLQYLHAMLSAAIAEEAVGETHLAVHWRAKAERLKGAIREAFWCEDRSLFASDVAHTRFSEHSQALALLADVLSADSAERCFRALVETPDLDRATIYYRHYLFLAYFKFSRADLFFNGLGFWRECLAKHSNTIWEKPLLNTRSDCHGWGAHLLWHLHNGVAGVKSAAPFFEKVTVAPQPGHLKRIRSVTPSPRGDIALDLDFSTGATGMISLPEGLTGEFVWSGKHILLHSGANAIKVP